MAKAMEPQGDSVYPRTAKEAHVHMRDLLDAALADDRSAFIITVKYLLNNTIDVKLGMMNADLSSARAASRRSLM